MNKGAPFLFDATSPTAGQAALLSPAIQQEEILRLREKVEQLSLQLEDLSGREALARQRAQDLQAELDARSIADQTPLLAAWIAQAEREIETLNAARQSGDAARLDLGQLLSESEARCETLKNEPAFTLGALLIAVLEDWRRAPALPRSLFGWWIEWKQKRDRPVESPLPASAAEFVQVAEAVAARAERDGVDAARQWAVDQRFRAPVLSRALLELAKLARKSEPGKAVSLAKAALDADPSETRAKHLAFTMMDSGSIRDASDILRAAIAQGAILNGSEARRREELAALERLQQSGLQLPAVRPGAAVAEGGRALILAAQSLPYHWNAISLRAHALAQCAKGAGLAPLVVTPPGYPAKEKKVPSEQTVEGVDYQRLDTVAAPAAAIDEHARACGAQLARVIREKGVSLIVSPLDLSLAYAAAAASALTGARLALDCQSAMSDLARSERESLFEKLEGELLDRADIVFARAAGWRVLLKRGRRRLAFLGDSFPVFEPERSSPDWRGEAALAGRFVIGYVGDPHDDLDLERLPFILDRLVAQGLDAALAVFGVGTRFQKLRATTEALGHGGRALFPGRPRLGAIGAAHEAIDLFVLPTTTAALRRERARFELIEALAHGKAVLTNAPGAFAPCVATAAATVESLAAEAAAIADDPARRMALEAGARELAVDALSTQAMTRRLVEGVTMLATTR